MSRLKISSSTYLENYWKIEKIITPALLYMGHAMQEPSAFFNFQSICIYYIRNRILSCNNLKLRKKNIFKNINAF